MPNCSAFGCFNRPGKCEDKSISFHNFPHKDKILLDKWIAKVQRVETGNKNRAWKPSKSSVLCSKHFKAEDFEEDNYVKYGLSSPSKAKRKLKKGAIPSVFVHKPDSTQGRMHSERRLKRKADNEVSVLHMLCTML